MRQTRQVSQSRRKRSVNGPSIQVICLGSSGGPSEDNATGLLVRSTASVWSAGSVLAVDAGSHLGAVTRILQTHFPHSTTAVHQEQKTLSPEDSSDRSESPESHFTVLSEGPFAGLPFPCLSAKANALHIVRQYVATYLITHPHLDHLVGFAINTAAFHNTSRPKRLAALPFTVNAIKQHIFNDVVWPNLTDEDDGVGFVSFQRLTEGGNNALGEGQSRGYIEVCDGLSTKGFRVSHGACASRPPASIVKSQPGSRRASLAQRNDMNAHTCVHASAGHAQVQTPTAADSISRRPSGFSSSQPPSPPANIRQDMHERSGSSTSCVVDSSAFFIRAEHTGKEVLIWGDVEPDTLSILPRNHIVWAEAATKIAHGTLGGIFIECSYDDSQPDAALFGHLAPRHIISELLVLADLVTVARSRTSTDESGASAISAVTSPSSKRKRQSGFNYNQLQLVKDETDHTSGKRRGSSRFQLPPGMSSDTSMSPSSQPTQRMDRAIIEDINQHNNLQLNEPQKLVKRSSPPTAALSSEPTDKPSALGSAATTISTHAPLKSLKVVIIHVKDNMQDGPQAEDIILSELLEHEAELQSQSRGLGCEFLISKAGESYWF